MFSELTSSVSNFFSSVRGKVRETGENAVNKMSQNILLHIINAQKEIDGTENDLNSKMKAGLEKMYAIFN